MTSDSKPPYENLSTKPGRSWCFSWLGNKWFAGEEVDARPQRLQGAFCRCSSSWKLQLAWKRVHQRFAPKKIDETILMWLFSSSLLGLAGPSGLRFCPGFCTAWQSPNGVNRGINFPGIPENSIKSPKTIHHLLTNKKKQTKNNNQWKTKQVASSGPAMGRAALWYVLQVRIFQWPEAKARKTILFQNWLVACIPAFMIHHIIARTCLKLYMCFDFRIPLPQNTSVQQQFFGWPVPIRRTDF